MDSLSHLLALLAPRCEVNLHCRFGGRWQAGHQQMRSGVVPWHVVLRGEGRLNVGGQTHHLRAGDVVLLPHGSPHLMESWWSGAVLPVAHRFNGTVTEMRAGPAEGALEMLCGEFYFGPHVSWLFSEASTLIHLHTDAREDCQSWTRCLIYWCARAWRSVTAAALSCAASAIRCWCSCCACCLASNSRPAGCCA